MTTRGAAAAALLALAVVLLPGVPAAAFDAGVAFPKGGLVLSVEGGGGAQRNIERGVETGLELGYGGVRLGYLPFGPVGTGPLRGALEAGLEAVYVRYTHPVDAFYAGLAAVGRYHFLALGRLVPYAEVGGAAGGTDLRIREIASDFSFLVFGGVGASVFLTERTALYAGYRILHVSNGNTDTPNHGFEAHTGLAGVSFYLK